MRFSLIALATPLLLAVSAIAGHNCKCQDSNGQYNDWTKFCCHDQSPALNVYHDDQVHQCSNSGGSLDSGAFVACCQRFGAGGAFCWD